MRSGGFAPACWNPISDGSLPRIESENVELSQARNSPDAGRFPGSIEEAKRKCVLPAPRGLRLEAIFTKAPSQRICPGKKAAFGGSQFEDSSTELSVGDHRKTVGSASPVLVAGEFIAIAAPHATGQQ